MRLDKLLQSQGFGTRRECRTAILNGALQIAGVVHDNPDHELDTAQLEGQTLCLGGTCWPFHAQAYLMLHKPAGTECSHAPKFYRPVYGLLPAELVRRGVQSVGRLDQDTTGLLLLSDDGQFVHRWSSGRKHTPKRYRIGAAQPITPDQCQQLLEGVLLDGETQPIRVVSLEQVDETTLYLVITEGKYHVVKRLLAAVGNHVKALHRDRIGGLSLPHGLAEGCWRWMTPDDLCLLTAFTD